MRKWLVASVAAVLAGGVIWHALDRETDAPPNPPVAELPQGAERVLTRLELRPTDTSRQREVADMIWLLSQRTPRVAQQAAEEARRIAPKSGIVRAALAYSSFAANESKEALSHAKQAAELGGLDGEAHLEVGFVLWQLAQADLALDHLARTVAGEPSLGEALLFIHVSTQEDKGERAVAVLKQAEESGSSDARANALVQGLVIERNYAEAASLSASLRDQSRLHWTTVPSAAFAAAHTGRADLADQVMRSPGGALSHHGLTHHRLAFAAVAVSEGQTKGAWEALRVSLAMIHAGEDSQSAWSDHTRLPIAPWPAAPKLESFWSFLAELQRSSDPYAEQMRGVGLLYNKQPELASKAFRHALTLHPGIEPSRTYLQTNSLDTWLEDLARLREAPVAGERPEETDA